MPLFHFYVVLRLKTLVQGNIGGLNEEIMAVNSERCLAMGTAHKHIKGNALLIGANVH